MWKSGHCQHQGVSFLSSRDKTQVVRRGDNHLYQVSHLATLLLFFFFETSSSDWLELSMEEQAGLRFLGNPPVSACLLSATPCLALLNI